MTAVNAGHTVRHRATCGQVGQITDSLSFCRPQELNPAKYLCLLTSPKPYRILADQGDSERGCEQSAGLYHAELDSGLEICSD